MNDFQKTCMEKAEKCIASLRGVEPEEVCEQLKIMNYIAFATGSSGGGFGIVLKTTKKSYNISFKIEELADRL